MQNGIFCHSCAQVRFKLLAGKMTSRISAKNDAEFDVQFAKLDRKFEPFTLWLFNIAMENGPFIEDFPIKPPFMVGIFHGYVSHNQMVHLPTQFFCHRGVPDGPLISFFFRRNEATDYPQNCGWITEFTRPFSERT